MFFECYSFAFCIVHAFVAIVSLFLKPSNLRLNSSSPKELNKEQPQGVHVADILEQMQWAIESQLSNEFLKCYSFPTLTYSFHKSVFSKCVLVISFISRVTLFQKRLLKCYFLPKKRFLIIVSQILFVLQNVVANFTLITNAFPKCLNLLSNIIFWKFPLC